MGPITIRLGVTGAYAFRECERCAWLAHNAGLVPPESPFAGILGAVDRIAKDYFDSFRRRGELPPPLRGLVEARLADPVPTLRPADLGILSVAGRLDEALVLQGGAVEPLDHKSAGGAKEDVHPSHRLQMDGYAWLLERNGHRTTGRGWLVYWVPGRGDLLQGSPWSAQAIAVDVSPARFEAVLRRADEVLGMPAPPPASRECGLCAYAAERARSGM